MLTQSNAILVYLAEKSGCLLPAVGAARSAVFEWLCMVVTDVIAPNFQAFQLARALGEDQAAAAVRALRQRAIEMYEPLDRHLAGRSFVAGADLSIADMAGYVITRAIGDSLPWDALRNVRRWFGTLEQRPAFRHGFAAFR